PARRAGGRAGGHPRDRPGGTVRVSAIPNQPRGVPRSGAHRLRHAGGRFVSGREGGLPDVRHVFRTLREGKPARLRGLREASALFRPQERQANRLPAAAMAVARAKIPSAGSAQSPLLGTAMFAPSVLFIALLIGVPFVLAVLYAFSDARIGATSFHYV